MQAAICGSMADSNAAVCNTGVCRAERRECFHSDRIHLEISGGTDQDRDQ